jgi:DNA mismatch repair ATPase MutS
MDNLNQFYAEQVAKNTTERQKVTHEIRLLTVGRLVAFLSFILFPIFLYTKSPVISIVLSLFSLAAFVFMVRKFTQAVERRRYLDNLIEINKNELLALDHQFDMFDDGKEYIDPDHFNAYDLDLFGKGSLFQFINRTVTLSGKEQLAQWFQHPMLNIYQLQKRQQLLKELSQKDLWRQNFAATGKMHKAEETDSRIFERWGNETIAMKAFTFTQALLVFLPFVSIATLLFWIVSGNSGLFILASLLQFSFWVFHSKNINQFYRQFSKKANLLLNYATLFNQIETEKWTSTEAKELIDGLNGLPSAEFKRLWRIISAFDNRNNMFVGVVINLIFSWDVRCTLQLAHWHQRNKTNFHQWHQLLSFFDAANSLANYAFNHPGFSYPQFADGTFVLNAEQMGHPLIHQRKRVSNNFEISGSQQLVVVTGANMAGKSTFLRTVGVNMVLGMTGAPVCAKNMAFKPVEVFSNMRTTDSLFNDESYFFAELKRLKMILDEMEKGRELLIILDEILKGTNSVDKLAGSQKLVQRLIHHKTPSIVATHDLKLTEMETQYPEQVKNQCFEIVIENNEMQFDYQLRSGATTIMNATFLMKKMGII